MSRLHLNGPQAIIPPADCASQDRVCCAEFGCSLEPNSLSWFDESVAEADESNVVKLMAAGIAHDINNMLHVSVGAIELLQNRIDMRRMKEISELSQIALMSLGRASAMAHDLLSFAGPARVRSKRICVSATLASMAPLLKCTLGDEIEIKLILVEGLAQIVCDRQRLESAVLNLVVNARDAMPIGGTLSITTFHTELPESQPGHALRKVVGIRVADTGEGMPFDVMQHAFEPFYTTKSRGTGLGLAMIKDLVERYRGSVSATSIVGNGTTVELYFPAA
jgi:signal transduction histidine kinase